MPTRIDHDEGWWRKFRALLAEPLLSWDAIAREMGCSRTHGLEQARKYGLRRCPRSRQQPCGEGAAPLAHRRIQVDVIDDLDRVDGALCAGHAISWGVITAGTLLDGELYPTPRYSHAAVTRDHMPARRAA